MHGRLYQNIILIGGNTAFEGYRKRVLNEVRSLASDLYTVRLRPVTDPITHAWNCGRSAIASLNARFVSKAEYEEHGPAICHKRYFIFHDF
ncbi:hypothetical protein AB6A40_010964 [Gnathostoma spinigerum]|uniref:Uncharacterized protein n=1 Tax=Gnathostoma spinigerum TaxID=75299 RepID=A0ABD6F458_9BILA